MTQVAGGNYATQTIYNTRNPQEGPHTVPVTLIFTGANPTQYVDLTIVKQQGKLSQVATVFVDNSTGNQPVLVTDPVTNQTVSTPAGVQGYYPFLASGGMKFTIYTAGTGSVNLQFINTFIPAMQWSAVTAAPVIANPLPVSDAILDGTVSANKVQVLMTPAQNTDTNGSGTIVTGGTPQQVFAANALRKGWMIQNIDETLLEELGVSTTTTTPAIGTPGTFGLAASGGVGFPGGSITGYGSGAIYIVAATAGHKFTAIQW